MILFKGSRTELLAPLQSVCGIVEKKHTIPILSNVLFEKNGSTLRLLASNIEMQICVTTKVQPELTETVRFTTGARKLQEILKLLNEDVETTLLLDDNRVILKSGESRFTLQTLPAEGFPYIAVSDEPFRTVIKLKQSELKKYLSLVHYAMGQHDVRYYLNGMCLQVDGNAVSFIATDGHRISYVRNTVEEEYSRTGAIIPRKSVLEVTRQLIDKDDLVEIDLSSSQSIFRFNNVELITKLIDGRFPEYENVIPKDGDKILTVSRIKLLNAMQRAAILTSENSRGVHLQISNNKIKITSHNSDLEEADNEIETDYSGDTIDAGFNVGYLLDVLNNINSEVVKCHFYENNSAMITYVNNNFFKYVVMPMKI